jgi:hypothetical protein
MSATIKGRFHLADNLNHSLDDHLLVIAANNLDLEAIRTRRNS